MNMTAEQAMQVVTQSLNEYVDPNRPQLTIVNGPRAELRGVPTAQVQAIVEAVQTLNAMVKRQASTTTEKHNGGKQQPDS